MREYFKFVLYAVVASHLSLAIAGAYEDFFRAVGSDDERSVHTLLKRGFDPNSLDEKGQTALILAIRGGSFRVARELVAHPAQKVDTPNHAGETALMIAALRGERDWVDQLLARGAQVDRPGWSPLHYAATGPQTQLVELMLARGAPIEARSPNGTTPLMMAARYGAEGSALLLLARGADPRARNDQGLDAAAFARLGGREALASRLEAAAR